MEADKPGGKLESFGGCLYTLGLHMDHVVMFVLEKRTLTTTNNFDNKHHSSSTTHHPRPTPCPVPPLPPSLSATTTCTCRQWSTTMTTHPDMTQMTCQCHVSSEWGRWGLCNMMMMQHCLTMMTHDVIWWWWHMMSSDSDETQHCHHQH